MNNMTDEERAAYEEKVHELLAKRDEVVIVDLRGPGEILQAHDGIQRAENIVWDIANSTIDVSAFPQDKNRPIMVFCRSGNRAAKCKALLETEGYTNVTNGYTAELLRSVCPECNL